MRTIKSNKGFTLVEIIMVIVISGIISGLVVMIIGRTTNSYHELERRDKLQSSARYALERISREIRHALPNSLCAFDGANCNNSSNRLYFIRAFDAGHYQDQPGFYPSGIARQPLPLLPITTTQFDAPSGIGLRLPAANQAVVINNLNSNLIYTLGANHIYPIANIDETVDTGGGNLISVLQFTNPIGFPTTSASKRFFIIEDRATIFYLQGTDLFRAASNRTTPNTPITPRLLLENVQALTFTYNPGQHQRAGLLQIDLTVLEDGEQIHLVHEAHVYNAS